MGKLGVGVIGVGWNGLLFCEKYQENPDTELVAICSTNPDRLESSTKRFGVKGYSDYDILKDEDISIISIHTPDPLHCEPFIKALEAGKHVFVEKPLADNLPDLKKILEASERHKDQVQLVGHILRFGEYFTAIKKWINSGILGEICYAESDYIHDLRYQEFLERWKVDEEIPMLGGGVHALDIIRYLVSDVCGEIKEVAALSNHISYKGMKEDTSIMANFQFENGAICKISTLYGSPAPRPFGFNVAVYGTKGSIVRDRICLDGIGEESMEIPHSLYDASFDFKPEVAHFVECIKTNNPITRSHPKDAANSVLAALYATRSYKEKQYLKIPSYEEFMATE